MNIMNKNLQLTDYAAKRKGFISWWVNHYNKQPTPTKIQIVINLLYE